MILDPPPIWLFLLTSRGCMKAEELARMLALGEDRGAGQSIRCPSCTWGHNYIEYQRKNTKTIFSSPLVMVICGSGQLGGDSSSDLRMIGLHRLGEVGRARVKTWRIRQFKK